MVEVLAGAARVGDPRHHRVRLQVVVEVADDVHERRRHVAVVARVAPDARLADGAAEQRRQDHRLGRERLLVVAEVLHQADHRDEVAVRGAVLLVEPLVEALRVRELPLVLVPVRDVGGAGALDVGDDVDVEWSA